MSPKTTPSAARAERVRSSVRLRRRAASLARHFALPTCARRCPRRTRQPASAVSTNTGIGNQWLGQCSWIPGARPTRHGASPWRRRHRRISQRLSDWPASLDPSARLEAAWQYHQVSDLNGFERTHGLLDIPARSCRPSAVSRRSCILQPPRIHRLRLRRCMNAPPRRRACRHQR